MEPFTGLTRGGTPWIPQFVTRIIHERCIGCGRCYKVCSRNVFDLVEREDLQDSFDDSENDEEMEDWEEDGFEDDGAMVMTVVNMDDCIGCESCSKVCPKECHVHAPVTRDKVA
ncbi:MAG: ferredoxin III, nif-specific [Nitrospirae bacterium]|nr:ferredoxin III, nif-specific [Magnetococcales bacterium]HAT49256.1 ferredoxin III, nif-specific [Alphaproteobacteria bacterium]